MIITSLGQLWLVLSGLADLRLRWVVGQSGRIRLYVAMRAFFPSATQPLRILSG